MCSTAHFVRSSGVQTALCAMVCVSVGAIFHCMSRLLPLHMVCTLFSVVSVFLFFCLPNILCSFIIAPKGIFAVCTSCSRLITKLIFYLRMSYWDPSLLVFAYLVIIERQIQGKATFPSCLNAHTVLLYNLYLH